MKKLLLSICIALTTSSAFAGNEQITALLMETQKNLGNKDYALQLGKFIKNDRDKQLIVKEALRHTAVVNSDHRDEALDMLFESGLVDQNERNQIAEQANSYNDIVFAFKQNVSRIDVEKSYTSYSCDGVEQRITDMNAIVPFKRQLRITDVSAYQDFLQFFNATNVVITTVPSAQKVIDYVKEQSRIKMIGIEEKLIANNATAVSMYPKVSNGDKTYLMFPYKMFPYPAANLSEQTMLEYAYFALNLKLVGRLTPEIYQTFNKIYRRNASFCLYAQPRR
jgi:hypothetical protein